MAAVRWQKQGAALVGDVLLTDGTPARVVLVGSRSTPKGAVLVTTGAQPGQLSTEPFYSSISRLPAAQLVEVICTQERQFGESALPPPLLP